jgi:hypothetical protein
MLQRVRPVARRIPCDKVGNNTENWEIERLSGVLHRRPPLSPSFRWFFSSYLLKIIDKRQIRAHILILALAPVIILHDRGLSLGIKTE